MGEEFTFKDPHAGHTITLKTVSTDSLEVIEHQRKARPAHVENLIASMERIGFVVPVVAVEAEVDIGERYLVIDGQHRLQAAQALSITEVPVLVVPRGLAQRMMNLNVEKDLNIREKASVSLGIYRTFLDTDPDLKEAEPEITESIERAYYVTLGIAYEEGSRLAGSAFEPLLKKCDVFLDEPVAKASEIREQRARSVLEANTLVKEVTDQAKEMGVWHQYFQYQLISYIDPYKRKRGPVDFDDLFGKAISKLEQLRDEPDRIGKVAGES
jgi:ParB-like chromosome segregation protein Spo0J